MSSYSFQGTSRVWIPRDEEENRAIFSARKQETGIKMPVVFKPVYFANAEFEVEKWSLKQLTRLLRLYGAHRCLWDVRNPENRNRKLRKAALIDITAAMGGGVPRAQVVQKINVLRATYRYEKRRIKQRIRKGIGAKTKLKWFALADAFLRNVPRTEKYRRNEDADTDSDLEDTIVFSIDPETLIPLDEEEEEEEQVDEKESDPHNEIIQYDFIKMEDDCPSDEFIDQHMPIITIKHEKLQTIKSEQYRETTSPSPASKPKWTATESLQFVHLLSDHPILFTEEVNECKEQLHAIKEIANAMQINEQRIEKRVLTFRRTYAQEKVKCDQNKNYKPSFVWWTEAERFMESNINNAQVERATHFVDTNDEPPATPLNMQQSQMHIKQESDEFQLHTASPATPINPIPSVAPPSMYNADMEEALEALFTSNTNDTPDFENTSLSLASKKTIKTENDIDEFIVESATLSPATQSPAAPLHVNDVDSCTKLTNDSGTNSSTKLIWNGLEDDLLEGKWSLKHSVKFLRLYGAHRCLWDLNDPDYRSRELRNAAIEDIAAAMGYNLDADYVAKKIKIFRITYMQHRKRMLEAIKEGKEPDIQLRWFPLADSFLRPHIGLRCIKERECEMPQFDFQYVYANLNLIDPALLTDFRGKGTQNQIEIGSGAPESLQKREVQVEDRA